MRCVLPFLLLITLAACDKPKAGKTLPRRKILVTNYGVTGSQNLIMARLADMLGARGNDVTLLQYEIMPQAKKLPLKHAKRIVYKVIEDDATIREVEQRVSSFTWKQNTMSLSGGKEFMQVMGKLFTEITGGCDRLIEKNQTLINEMKSKKYDAIILHMIDFCTLSLTKHLGVKAYAYFSTAYLMDPMARYSGASYPASYVPSSVIHTSDRMSFVERLKNLVYGTALNGLVDVTMFRMYNNIITKHFGADYPSMQELLTETQLFFINTDAFFEYPRPSQANIIEVGGLTMGHPEPLKSDWLKVLDSSRPRGVVVFSLGTVANTSHMPMELRAAFVNAFKQFPDFTFITRIDGDMTIAKTAANIHLTSWIPQKDLLAHEKVKAFITHGGYNSLTEATYLGVPMVMLPLFGDQGQNAKRVERLGLGVTLDKNTATETDVYNALDSVLNNPEYARKASHLSQMMRGKPFSSEETAMRWIEFLADYKDLDILKPESRHMSFVTYYNLDVLAFLHLIAAVTLYGMYAVMRCCYRRCCAKKAVTTSKKKRQ